MRALRAVFLAVPLALILGLVTLPFLAAHAPRTWAAHWSAGYRLPRVAGAGGYAVVKHGSGLDILTVDSTGRRMSFIASRARPVVLDYGDVSDATLTRVGGQDIAAWVHNYNGGTDLMAAILSSRPHVFRLIHGRNPLEKPHLFAGPGGSVGLVFSWQRYGNFDSFLLTLPRDGMRPTGLYRLTHAVDYSYSPLAITDGAGVDLLHLEVCCRQQIWNVVLSRFDWHGRHLGAPRLMARLQELPVEHDTPTDWGADLVKDPAGHVWGTFTTDEGAAVFEMVDGRMVAGPRLVYSGGGPTQLALGVSSTTGWLAWPQAFDLGSYVVAESFSLDLKHGGQPQRVSYESAMEGSPRIIMNGEVPSVVWQAVPPGLAAHYEVAAYRVSVTPTLAERLGLGLGNPWQELGVLLVSAMGVGLLAVVANLVTLFLLIGVALLVARLLRRIPGRWLLFTGLLTVALYLFFVTPGGPSLFLSTLPAMGFPAAPYGVLAAVAVLAGLLWIARLLKRVEDPYRAAILVVSGMYFFAFLEAAVFVQQRLGYI